MSKCHFNYNDGDAIGFIKKNSKILYIKRNDKSNDINCSVCNGRSKSGCSECGNNSHNVMDDEMINSLIKNHVRNIKERISFKQIEQLEEALINQEEPENQHLKKLYDIANLQLGEDKQKEIIIKNGEIEPIINPNAERQVFYISGMSGSGKSTYVNKIINSYNKFFKKNKIYLFSNKEHDDSYTNKNIIKMSLNEDLVDDPITLEEIKDSMVIFDDIEGVPSKKIMNELDRLRDVILQQGRSYKVYFCYVSHLANNYKQTRTILNECHSITIFPAMTTTYSLKYLLEKYFGFSKDDIKKLLSLNSRWVTIFKMPCIFVMHEDGAYLVN